jgi:hypothetical protein
MERIEALLSREAIFLRRTGAQSLAVVLRPDSDTELWVQFNQNAGHLEATVRCDRGDMGSMAAHWSQLQEALAAHEIRLLPIPTSTAQSETSWSASRHGFSEDRNPQQDPHAPERHSETRHNRNTPSPDSHTREETPARRVSRNRWESWA